MIARPTALFGVGSQPMAMSDDMMKASGMMMAEKGTARDRLVAVGYVLRFLCSKSLKSWTDSFLPTASVTLIGVMGFAGGCGFSPYRTDLKRS